MPIWILFLLAGVAAYCLGSISTGILVSRAMHGPDLYTVGSRNTGATNVQRTMGWKPGLITFWGDAIKALIACFLGQLITGSHEGALFAGIWVIIGHNWPVFFGFRGGKGVASSCGVLLFCFPLHALICFAAGLTVILLTKYVSAGSLTVLILYAILISVSGILPGALYIPADWRGILWAVLLAGMCILRHRSNIQRLINGTENKLGGKKKL